MTLDKSTRQTTEKTLSDQFVEYIDLTDKALAEIEVLELSGIHGLQSYGCFCTCVTRCNGCGGFCSSPSKAHEVRNEGLAERNSI